MNLRSAILPTLLLGTLVVCGGGGGGGSTPTPTATTLNYTNPTSGTYLLKKNDSLSSSTHLVLEVWGPASPAGSGITVNFTLAGNAATWRNVSASDPAATYVANGTAFSPASAPILKAKLTGSTLVATAAEKGTASPKSLSQALIRVAVDLNTGAPQGATSTITPDAAKCQVLLGDGSMPAITVATSPITAQ